MQVTVKFSGLFNLLAGVGESVVELPDGATIERMIDALCRKYTNLPLRDEKTYYVVNHEMAARDQVLGDGDQLMIFQMSAGG